MSKYNLEEIHISNVKENMSADDQARFDNLTKDDQLKLEKIFSMMKAEKDAKKSTNEDFDSVVDKIKDSGKSEEDAKKIAGAINAKYVGNYREGVEESDAADYTEEIAEENDEDKLPMDEVRVDNEVSERIEGMLSIPLKKKFLDSFMDLWQDLIEEDPFYAEDVINHLNNEMHREIDGFQAQGDRLAGIGESSDKYVDEIGEGAMQPGEADLEAGVKGNMDALNEVSMKDVVLAIVKDTNATNPEVQMYIDSLTKDIKLNGKESYSDYEIDDYIEDFKNYISDKALQEHFGRFMKDYQ